MATGTLDEEVKRKRAAEYLNGLDDEPDDSTEEQDAADDLETNVQSSDSDLWATEDPDPDVLSETDTGEAPETVPAPSKKYEYNYVLKPVGTDFTQTPSPPRPPSLEPVE